MCFDAFTPGSLSKVPGRKRRCSGLYLFSLESVTRSARKTRDDNPATIPIALSKSSPATKRNEAVGIVDPLEKADPDILRQRLQ